MAYLLVIATGSRGSRFYKNTLEQNDVEDYHSADQGEAETMQDIDKRSAQLYQEEDTAMSYDLPSDKALRRETCIEHAYKKGSKTYFECKSRCCCQGQKTIKVACEKHVCENCRRTSLCRRG